MKLPVLARITGAAALLLTVAAASHAQQPLYLDYARILEGQPGRDGDAIAALPSGYTYVLNRLAYRQALDDDPRTVPPTFDTSTTDAQATGTLAVYDARGRYLRQHNFVGPLSGFQGSRILRAGEDGYLYALYDLRDSLDYDQRPSRANTLTASGDATALLRIGADGRLDAAALLPAGAFAYELDVNADGQLLLVGGFDGTIDADLSGGGTRMITSADGGAAISGLVAVYDAADDFRLLRLLDVPPPAVAPRAGTIAPDGTVALPTSVTGGGQAFDGVLAGVRVTLTAGDPTFYPAALRYDADDEALDGFYWLGTANGRAGTFTSAVALPGAVYVAGEVDLTSSSEAALLAQFSPAGRLVRRYHATVGRARVARDRGASGLLVTVDGTGQWTDALDGGRDVGYGSGGGLANSDVLTVLAVDTALALRRRNVEAARALVATMPDGRVVLRGVHPTRGYATLREDGAFPYEIYRRFDSGDGVYVTWLTPDCVPAEAVSATERVVSCGAIGGQALGYFFGEARGTGLRYRWFDEETGDPIGDSHVNNERFVVAGSRAATLYRAVTIDQGYGVSRYRLRVADGCGGATVAAPSASEFVAAGPPGFYGDGGQVAAVARGAEVSFEARASQLYPDSLLEWQWYLGGFALREGVKFAGTQTRTLRVRNVDFDDDGAYVAESRVAGCDVNTRGASTHQLFVDGYELLRPGGEHERTKLVAWPNPSPGAAVVGNPGQQTLRGELRVLDAMGVPRRTLRGVELAPSQGLPLDLAGLPDGLYRVILADRTGAVSTTITLQTRP